MKKKEQGVFRVQVNRSEGKLIWTGLYVTAEVARAIYERLNHLLVGTPFVVFGYKKDLCDGEEITLIGDVTKEVNLALRAIIIDIDKKTAELKMELFKEIHDKTESRS